MQETLKRLKRLLCPSSCLGIVEKLWEIWYQSTNPVSPTLSRLLHRMAPSKQLHLRWPVDSHSAGSAPAWLPWSSLRAVKGSTQGRCRPLTLNMASYGTPKDGPARVRQDPSGFRDVGVPHNLQPGLMCIENLVDGHLHIPIEGWQSLKCRLQGHNNGLMVPARATQDTAKSCTYPSSPSPETIEKLALCKAHVASAPGAWHWLILSRVQSSSDPSGSATLQHSSAMLSPNHAKPKSVRIFMSHYVTLCYSMLLYVPLCYTSFLCIPCLLQIRVGIQILSVELQFS